MVDLLHYSQAYKLVKSDYTIQVLYKEEVVNDRDPYQLQNWELGLAGLPLVACNMADCRGSGLFRQCILQCFRYCLRVIRRLLHQYLYQEVPVSFRNSRLFDDVLLVNILEVVNNDCLYRLLKIQQNPFFNFSTVRHRYRTLNISVQQVYHYTFNNGSSEPLPQLRLNPSYTLNIGRYPFPLLLS